MNTKQEIVLRLKKIIDFNKVGGAANEDRIRNSFVRSPSCFVIKLENDSGENTALNGVRQRVTEYYGIYIVVENMRQEHAEDSTDIAEALSRQVKNFLLNWKPFDALTGMLYGGGKLIDLDDNILIWAEIYSCEKQIQQLKENK